MLKQNFESTLFFWKVQFCSLEYPNSKFWVSKFDLVLLNENFIPCWLVIFRRAFVSSWHKHDQTWRCSSQICLIRFLQKQELVCFPPPFTSVWSVFFIFVLSMLCCARSSRFTLSNFIIWYGAPCNESFSYFQIWQTTEKHKHGLGFELMAATRHPEEDSWDVQCSSEALCVLAV